MNTVKMENLDTGIIADVHPDEVENYRTGGYRLVYSEADAAEQAEAKPKSKAKK